MQMTVAEHQRSPAAEKRCATCHMPLVEGHRSHRFAASRSEAMIRAAIDVVAKRTKLGIELTLTAAGALGHAFPTGDLFRRLTIVAEAKSVVPQVIHLGRRFGPREEIPGVPVRVEIADDRIEHGKPRVVALSLLTDDPIHWRVTYERVEFPMSDGDAVVEGSIVVAEGSI
jgi:hypothetical protein